MKIDNPLVRILIALAFFAIALFFMRGAIDSISQMQEAINIIYGG